MEWKSGRAKSYFQGKDVVVLGDEYVRSNKLFESRAVWEPVSGLLEIWMWFNTEWRVDESKTARAICREYRKLFGVKGRTICDVQCGQLFLKTGKCANRLAWYGKLKERPEIEKIKKSREVAENVAVQEDKINYYAERIIKNQGT